MNDNYRPLPKYLTISPSEIEGLGLFAVEDIPEGVNLGISHVDFKNGAIIRTPLGGFYNHSEDPNVERVKMYDDHVISYSLKAIKDIKAGEEITCKYTLYTID